MKKPVRNSLDNYSSSIIHELKEEFETHDFITEFIYQNEVAYIELLYECKSFTKLHAQIGKYLLNNKTDLGIEKDGGKDTSRTNKGTLSENQKWRKL